MKTLSTQPGFVKPSGQDADPLPAAHGGSSGGLGQASSATDIGHRIFWPSELPRIDSNSTALVAEDKLTLFGKCLALDQSREDITLLRLQLLADPLHWSAILNIAELFSLLPALAAQLDSRGLLPPMLPLVRSDTIQPTEILRTETGRIQALRSAARDQLVDILQHYNAVGIEPLLLKGARSLWCGRPAWRHLSDLDLLVRSADLAKAQDALREQGYEFIETSFREHSWSHHAPPLARSDLAMMVENHGRASNRYAERLLPTSELWDAAQPVEMGGAKARVLPPELHVLHGLLHYHVGHRGDRAGTVHIRGLYEFAWEFSHLDADGLSALHGRTRMNPRLSAPLDFWLAAANELFALPVRWPFQVYADAAARWRETKRDYAYRTNYRTIRHFGAEIRMACHPDRLAAAGWGHSRLHRMLAAAQVMGSLIRPKMPRPLP